MNEKERAEQIINQMASAIGSFNNELVLNAAIKCASICANEVLNSPNQNEYLDKSTSENWFQNYWYNVINEIAKIRRNGNV